MAQFSGEGGAKFFDKCSARHLIQTDIVWKANLALRNRDIELIDNEKLKAADFNYFVSVRSSYLPARHNKVMIIEPYSPHRFERQFGFCQDMPGFLKKQVHIKTTNDLLYYWKVCICYNTKAKLICPARPTDLNNFVTARYTEWWSTVYKPSLNRDIDALISSIRTTSSKIARQQKDDIEKSSKVKQDKTKKLTPTEPIQSSKAPKVKIIQSLPLVVEKKVPGN